MKTLLFALLLCSCNQTNRALDDAARVKAELASIRADAERLANNADRLRSEAEARCSAALVVLREVDTVAPQVCAFAAMVPEGESSRVPCSKLAELSAAVKNVEKMCGLLGE